VYFTGQSDLGYDFDNHKPYPFARHHLSDGDNDSPDLPFNSYSVIQHDLDYQLEDLAELAAIAGPAVCRRCGRPAFSHELTNYSLGLALSNS
jgi:hypothetical protein